MEHAVDEKMRKYHDMSLKSVGLTKEALKIPDVEELRNSVLRKLVSHTLDKSDSLVHTMVEFFKLLKQDSEELFQELIKNLIKANEDNKTSENVHLQELVEKFSSSDDQNEKIDVFIEFHKEFSLSLPSIENFKYDVMLPSLKKVEELGNNHFDNDCFEKALPYFVFLTIYDFSNPRYWFFKGFAELEEKKYDWSIASFFKFIQMKPCNPLGYIYVSKALISNHQVKEAKEIFSRFLDEGKEIIEEACSFDESLLTLIEDLSQSLEIKK